MKNKKITFAIISSIIIILATLFIYKRNNLLSSKIEWGYYLNNEKIANMPKFNQDDGIFFEHAECDNGASIEWDNKRWGPILKNLTKSNTKCSLYFIFEKKEIAGKVVPLAKISDGLYKVAHDVSEIDEGWNQEEYRYAGANPNNYVKFNNEIWRIIGLVNVKTANGVEQRIKIVRTDGIEVQKNFGNYAWDRPEEYTNNWTTSKLKDMLNGIYYESGTGECYTGKNGRTSAQNTCDFNSGTDLPKGLDETAREMIDKEVIWNLGGSSTDQDVTVKMFYERERGTSTGNSNTYPAEWSRETDVGEKQNGIGLIYPSDYGYATNGGNLGRETCFAKALSDWNSDKGNYQIECGETNWLKSSSGYLWTLSPRSSSFDSAFYVFIWSIDYNSVPISYANSVWPTAYLVKNVTITSGEGTIDEPYELSVQ